ncbi:UvrB/UvrC motif-containing protein [Desulfoscipio geothermicus]|uniref:Protein-arginine kinase activator protein McsA n=1 Tax=Desulfoscipio geothermicus DSM 3669 TaxID=1121426 RepID=A0A1I6DV33_9FIRM|nr:UvrB/UvrC motif-containing protein [Desulfoscipio geothermicus]SFR09370.1 Protein-arginine kinase activator protein McsA [Desulfoscipio geothermicus DSM 3669]
MLCEKCQERPATVHYTEIINNKQKKMHLCEVCAGQLQAEGFNFMPQMNLHNFLAGFWNQVPGTQNFAPHTRKEAGCPACGAPESLLAKKGLFGCGDCYKHFGDRLEPLMRRIHGSSTHTGKVPERAGGRARLLRKIETLRARLQDAVNREAFEEAAQLRDQIKELEKQL